LCATCRQRAACRAPKRRPSIRSSRADGDRHRNPSSQDYRRGPAARDGQTAGSGHLRHPAHGRRLLRERHKSETITIADPRNRGMSVKLFQRLGRVQVGEGTNKGGASWPSRSAADLQAAAVRLAEDADQPDRVVAPQPHPAQHVAPQPHPAQHDILAVGGPFMYRRCADGGVRRHRPARVSMAGGGAEGPRPGEGRERDARPGFQPRQLGGMNGWRIAARPQASDFTQ